MSRLIFRNTRRARIVLLRERRVFRKYWPPHYHKAVGRETVERAEQ